MKSDYDIGFDKGHDKGYKLGYQEGFMWGQMAITPDSFAKGFSYGWSLTDTQKKAISEMIAKLEKRIEIDENVATDIVQALAYDRGLSIVRLGDGEILTMSQNLLPIEALELRGQFLKNGHLPKLPDPKSQTAVINAVWQADWVGLPIGRGFSDCDVLLAQILLTKGPLYARMTSSVINYRLAKCGHLSAILKDCRVIAVGNTARALSDLLNFRGYNCVGAIHPVNGVPDVEQVFQKIAVHDFDIALIASGVAAVPLCVLIAERMGKVALDLGHVSDEWISGTVKLT